MKIIQVKIDDLKPAEYNPRKADEKQVEGVKQSIKEFGLVEPIVVNSAENRRNIIIGGHLRHRVAKLMGFKEMPVVYVNIPDIAKERELNLRLNKNLGEWDYDLLANFSEEELNKVGFESEELDKIFQLDAGEDDFDAEAEVEKIEDCKVKTGDLYQLGEHRLLCGDSTKKEDVEKLMGGEKADIILTDPPYGIGKDIENDDLIGKDFDNFNNDWISMLPESNVFVCYHSTRTFPSVLIKALDNGWEFERMLWFYRPDKFPANTWKGWMMVSQAIMLFTKEEVNYAKISPADQDCYVYTSSDLGEASGHPTEKIIKNIGKLINHFKGKIIYDGFGGSGSTLIACEQLNRKCYMCEIDNKYIQVIINRWEKLTNNKAHKIVE
jgi:16S rRNA G966 N2-methylase RsmD